jgi:hypothetical protein
LLAEADPRRCRGDFGEDCLFVNAWRPVATAPGAALPILVWIHGGGFLNGGSSAPMFDGSALARQGLVAVSLNYRLGRLGFFMHPALTATGEEAAGNYGFLDQLAALQWVRGNIAAFDGDSQQVTIAGESAGGISVMHHLTSRAAEGLFQPGCAIRHGRDTERPRDGRCVHGLHRRRQPAALPRRSDIGLRLGPSTGAGRFRHPRAPPSSRELGPHRRDGWRLPGFAGGGLIW